MLSTNARHRATGNTNVRRFVAAMGIAGMTAVIPVATAGTASAYAPSTSEQTSTGAEQTSSNTGTATTTVPTAQVTTRPTASKTATTNKTPAAAPAAKSRYVVVAGDTLSRLAATNKVSGGWKSLYDLNRDVLTAGPDLIEIGQSLRLTGSATTLSKAPTSTKPSTTKPTSSTGKASTSTTVTKKPAKTTTSSSSSSASSSSSSSTTAGTSSSKAAKAIAFARAQIGKPYVYGATGPSAYDCSGLVQAAYKSAGVSLPRVTGAQFSAGTKVSISNLRPGDLVFFYSGVSHVGIYIGDGKMVHAANPRKPIEIASIDTMPIAGATRPA